MNEPAPSDVEVHVGPSVIDRHLFLDSRLPDRLRPNFHFKRQVDEVFLYP